MIPAAVAVHPRSGLHPGSLVITRATESGRPADPRPAMANSVPMMGHPGTGRLAGILAVATGLVLPISTGCGGQSGPPTAAVSGRVTIDGAAVEGVEVRFLGPGLTAVGTTAADGTYRLERGAAIGMNTVCLSKFTGTLPAGIDSGQLEAMAAAQPAGQGEPKIRQLIPRRFSDPAGSELSFDVAPAGSTAANFDLPAE